MKNVNCVLIGIGKHANNKGKRKTIKIVILCYSYSLFKNIYKETSLRPPQD